MQSCKCHKREALVVGRHTSACRHLFQSQGHETGIPRFCAALRTFVSLLSPSPTATLARQSWLAVANTCCLALRTSLAEAVEGVRVVLAVLGLFSQSQKVLGHLPSMPAL